MNDLPASRVFSKRDVFSMMALTPLETVTRSLRMGDAHVLETLMPLANRCRALADAYDARMAEIREEK